MRVVIATAVATAVVLSGTTAADATTKKAETQQLAEEGVMLAGTVPCKLQMRGHGSSQDFTCGLSAACCYVLRAGQDAQAHGGPPISIALGPDSLIGKCGRADQVAAYDCAVPLLPSAEKKETCAIEPSAKTGTDGSGTCRSTFAGRPGEITEISQGCCDSLEAAMKAAKRARGPMMDNPNFKAAVCGMIGACGKKDQLSVLKFVKRFVKIRIHPQGEELEMLEELDMPELDAEGAQQFFEMLVGVEAEDHDEDEGLSQTATGLVGFVSGAAFTALGVAILRRKVSLSLEDPLIA